MKTKLNNLIIDWFEDFFHSSSVADDTISFAKGELPAAEWIRLMWPKPTQNLAKRLVKRVGVASARRRAMRAAKENYIF